ncbi:hypothetical protein [Rhizobium leguminosarum]|uniref:hypothetical protein n=1 Tax=Rhizobium leguminosarum TaxID=384 RepID=UPI00103E2712|nr:hypothetical protein [Rhizobium leguminosarum]TBZ07453.1 hypothetical protein E0H38_29950 [Rhizobium leguminosarum bv. viciae]TBZ54638.1 hypothetical protein E0H48_23010 [Rhizobium leguminosarum bv. viciae]
MVGPDPVLIEVKLGEPDTRGRQQRDSIRQLMEFFENDEIPNLRGLGKIYRTAHHSPELCYADVMEDTIIAAARTGAAFKSPAAASRGLKTTLFSREEDSVFELIEPLTGRNIRLAWQLFDRLAFEFTSPGWLLEITVERLNSQGGAVSSFL